MTPSPRHERGGSDRHGLAVLLLVLAASRDGVPDDWIAAARRSPVWALIGKYRIALPLHPEFRTLPMVWYVPPLSPVLGTLPGGEAADPDDVFPAIDRLRIPMQYLANLLAAGDPEVIRGVLKRLAAMRAHMRGREVGGRTADHAATVGMTTTEIEAMYRLLAIAKYDERYVIPQAHTETAGMLMEQQGTGGLGFPPVPPNYGAIPVKTAPAPNGTDTARFMLTQPPRPGVTACSVGADALAEAEVRLVDMLRARRRQLGEATA